MQIRASRIVEMLVTAILIAGCCHNGPAQPASPPAATSSTGPAQTFASPKTGKSYARTQIGLPDNDEPVVIPPLPPGAAPSGDNYHGTARKAAKLSVADGSAQTFNDLADLLDSLPSDDDMRAQGISMGADSGRVAQEQKNVTVTAYLYAASKEADNDFHCIVGRDPSQPPRFMNMEVSGLPPASSEFITQLRTARDQFKTFFTSNGNNLPLQGYDKYDPPIPIKISGSLFFDVDHPAGAVGPQGLKPKTAWEVHPVTDIQFEP